MSRVRSQFYKKAADYWANVPATIDGVLGGYEHISNTDIEGSDAFLQYILHLPAAPSTKQVLDCGAGIGRVSKYLLMPAFDKVDLVDLDEKFLAKAKEELDGNDKLGTIYKKGLQNFYPEKSYDLIWCQWVLGHLKDYDLLYFLKRCSESLSKNGVIVVKENITQSGEMEYDEEDSSVIRPYVLMRKIFEEADLEVIKECVQTDFPDDIYPVHMFALVPSKV